MDGRDQRNHISLVAPEFRDRLARVGGPYIGDYVSWALDISMQVRAAAKARALHIKYGQEYPAEAEKLATAMRIIEQMEANAQALYESWCRHIDLEVSRDGKSREEVVRAITNETGRMLPAEMARQEQHPTVQIVQANGSSRPQPQTRRWYGLGEKK